MYARTYIHIYIYICMCIYSSVCVCLCVYNGNIKSKFPVRVCPAIMQSACEWSVVEIQWNFWSYDIYIVVSDIRSFEKFFAWPKTRLAIESDCWITLFQTNPIGDESTLSTPTCHTLNYYTGTWGIPLSPKPWSEMSKMSVFELSIKLF